jgi:hypothetical protein
MDWDENLRQFGLGYSPRPRPRRNGLVVRLVRKLVFLFFLTGCFWAMSIDALPVLILCLLGMLAQFFQAWETAL